MSIQNLMFHAPDFILIDAADIPQITVKHLEQFVNEEAICGDRYFEIAQAIPRQGDVIVFSDDHDLPDHLTPLVAIQDAEARWDAVSKQLAFDLMVYVGLSFDVTDFEHYEDISSSPVISKMIMEHTHDYLISQSSAGGKLTSTALKRMSERLLLLSTAIVAAAGDKWPFVASTIIEKSWQCYDFSGKSSIDQPMILIGTFR